MITIGSQLVSEEKEAKLIIATVFVLVIRYFTKRKKKLYLLVVYLILYVKLYVTLSDEERC